MYKFVCMLGVFRLRYKKCPSQSGMCEIPAKYSSSLHGVKFCEERRCDIYEVAERRRRGSAGSRWPRAAEVDRRP